MRGVLVLFSIVMLACSHSSYKSSNKVYKKKAQRYAKIISAYPLHDTTGLKELFVGTTNFSIRKPNYVIIHYTAQKSCDETLKTFTIEKTQVSSHYVICKDGTIYHMLNDYLRGHHAGVSKWGSVTDLNSCSIGIEIDNNGADGFSSMQIESLLQLLQQLKQTYAIPAANFLGHSDIAIGRKIDPGRKFPWEQLALKGFGYWYDTVSIKVPQGFDPMLALRVIGYDTKKPQAAIQSYRLHFTQLDSSKTLQVSDYKILSSLLKKYE